MVQYFTTRFYAPFLVSAAGSAVHNTFELAVINDEVDGAARVGQVRRSPCPPFLMRQLSAAPCRLHPSFHIPRRRPIDVSKPFELHPHESRLNLAESRLNLAESS
jgi:hypothetical protein